MGSVGAGLVLGEKTMARQRGVVGRGLGVRVREVFAIDGFHIFTRTNETIEFDQVNA